MSNLKSSFHSFGNPNIFHFCDFTKWHYAILWNHKNAKSIVICLNLKITKEGGNSRQFFPATFLKIKFHNWPGLNFRGWPTWKTKQQSSFFSTCWIIIFWHPFRNCLCFFPTWSNFRNPFKQLATSSTDESPTQHSRRDILFFSHAVMFAEEILRPCIGFHNKKLRWNLDMTMSNGKIKNKTQFGRMSAACIPKLITSYSCHGSPCTFWNSGRHVIMIVHATFCCWSLLLQTFSWCSNQPFS